jgi:hypothetical protein
VTTLFRFPSAKRQDPAVDSWLRSKPADLGSLAQTWFDQMRKCGSDVRDVIHDGCPVACVEDVAFGYVNVFNAHVNVGFYLGAYLDDPDDLLEGTGKRMRHVKLHVGVDCNEMALRRLIEDAYMDAKRRVAESDA